MYRFVCPFTLLYTQFCRLKYFQLLLIKIIMKDRETDRGKLGKRETKRHYQLLAIVELWSSIKLNLALKC